MLKNALTAPYLLKALMDYDQTCKNIYNRIDRLLDVIKLFFFIHSG